jgi:hypothetical protein
VRRVRLCRSASRRLRKEIASRPLQSSRDDGIWSLCQGRDGRRSASQSLLMFGYSRLGYRISCYQRVGGHCSRSAIQGCDPSARGQSCCDIYGDSRNCTRRPFLVNHLGHGDGWDCSSARLSSWNRDTRRHRMMLKSIYRTRVLVLIPSIIC